MGGLWLVVFLAFEYLASKVGSFGGLDRLSSPYDSVVVAVGSLALYAWGVRSGIAFMRSRPDDIETLRAEAGADHAAATT